jgi:Domain of unknown function (DUF4328)
MVGIRAQAGLQSLKVWAAVTRVTLVVFLLIALLLAAFAGYLTYVEFSQNYSIFLITQPGFAGWLFLGFLLSCVPLALWVWRAHANLRDDGLDGLSHSPAWAALSLFVPVANLIVPFQAMRALWNRSHGEEVYFMRQSVEAVTSWWACYVSGMLVHAFLAFIVALDQLTDFAVMNPAGVNTFFLFFATALLAGSAFFLFRIVGAITRAQATVTSIGDTFA